MELEVYISIILIADEQGNSFEAKRNGVVLSGNKYCSRGEDIEEDEIMKNYVRTDHETGYITSTKWGSGPIVEKDGNVITVHFPDGLHIMDSNYYFKKGDISYAILEREEVTAYLKEEIGVQNLIHYTPVENLPSIFQNGILPLSADPAKPEIHNNCSLSVTSPDYRSLSMKKKKMPGSRFAILKIDPELLLYFEESNVAYYSSNASEPHYRASTFGCHRGIYSLQRMFADVVHCQLGTVLREDQVLTDTQTTHPEAEILIRGIVPAEYIRSVVVPDETDAEFLTNKPEGVSVEYDASLLDTITYTLPVTCSGYPTKQAWKEIVERQRKARVLEETEPKPRKTSAKKSDADDFEPLQRRRKKENSQI